ncbi:Cas4 family endonuclease [Mycobacterium phage LilPharaoh]|uniref:Exonuclease n=1 Tax=Mycobacterium phage Amelie TaxID=1913035 RepID=A0A1J0GR84_9CAUD|nr:exonuclease [Mycobacterium phage Enkosi]YP_009952568.1 exonuclease [Mycobacterium phage Amelie]ATN90503.1 Cas4 family endonuclease [Mycobacterium phage LilPharaoh]AVP42627.1 Cas4 family endonuclease [Mycobacterium phage SgtBeansprout]AXC37156.1 Cas4 family endonuclease [Mycobacterium phage Biglebops]QGJ93335.1 Cas4 family endonuclease [Mycobacterium phage Mdavu]UQS94450.1 Cas4 family exonuclease [Mycobacterium phage Nutello]UXE03213.1 Cas4 family exonuclease [Mycobacterium phage Nikao]
MSANAKFFGLTDDAHERDRPPTADQEFNDTLLADLKGVFKRAWSQHSRSLQKALGPSEIGHPCPRRLASAMLDLPRINPEGDPLPAWLGTAGHAKFEDAVNLDNERIIDRWLKDRAQRCTVLRGIAGADDPMYVGRWFTERRVTVRGGLSGTCDLYDTWTDTVIDLKFPGASRFNEYKKFGPVNKAPEYRVQAHAYGRGYRNEGFPVQRVAIWFVPRGGTLSSSFVWSEQYSDAIVDEALERLDNITIAIDELRVDEHPERIAMLPKVTGTCMFCPYFTPAAGHPEPHACRGDVA